MITIQYNNGALKTVKILRRNTPSMWDRTHTCSICRIKNHNTEYIYTSENNLLLYIFISTARTQLLYGMNTNTYIKFRVTSLQQNNFQNYTNSGRQIQYQKKKHEEKIKYKNKHQVSVVCVCVIYAQTVIPYKYGYNVTLPMVSSYQPI